MILLLGGARSGKSATAVRLAAASGLPVTFIATGEPRDEEMAVRIDRHRAARPAGWTTVEEPIELAAAIASVAQGRYIVLDCLTLWVSNLLGADRSDADVVSAASLVAELLQGRDAAVVSNEVGLGIVPASPEARRYRDLLGEVNATCAARATRTLLLVAGRALELNAMDPLVGAG